MDKKLSRIRLLLLLVALVLGAAGFIPSASTADVPDDAAILGPCGDMGCPGGPNFCDYLPGGSKCNCNVENCQPVETW